MILKYLILKMYNYFKVINAGLRPKIQLFLLKFSISSLSFNLPEAFFTLY